MRLLFMCIVLLPFIPVSGQRISISDKKLVEKCDSILAEANLLYQYERMAWTSTDLVREKQELINEVSSYIVYSSADTLKAVFINGEMESIYELSYLPSADEYLEDDLKRPLTEQETDLFLIRNTILEEALSEKYEVVTYDGYSLNVILLPFKKDYKLYILTGTGQRNIIPFTNDYLFIADRKGKVKSFRKFHSAFLPAQIIMPDGSRVVEVTHSHLASEPFISATDICTFKLYAPLYNVDHFGVYSPALSTTFIYYLSDDRIGIFRE